MTVPASIIKKSSVDSIGADKLLHAHETGQLSGSERAAPAPMTNDFDRKWITMQIQEIGG